MEKLKEYLFNEILSIDPDSHEVRQAKLDYKKKYNKQYNINYIKKVKRKEIILSISEFNKIEKLAKQYKMKPGTFIKTCLFAYMENKYILPDRTDLHKLIVELKRIGNNINQITIKLHQTGQWKLFDSDSIYSSLFEMEKIIIKTLESPVNLISRIISEIEAEPEFVEKLQLIISRYKIKQSL